MSMNQNKVNTDEKKENKAVQEMGQVKKDLKKVPGRIR